MKKTNIVNGNAVKKTLKTLKRNLLLGIVGSSLSAILSGCVLYQEQIDTPGFVEKDGVYYLSWVRAHGWIVWFIVLPPVIFADVDVKYEPLTKDAEALNGSVSFVMTVLPWDPVFFFPYQKAEGASTDAFETLGFDELKLEDGSKIFFDDVDRFRMSLKSRVLRENGILYGIIRPYTLENEPVSIVLMQTDGSEPQTLFFLDFVNYWKSELRRNEKSDRKH